MAALHDCDWLVGKDLSGFDAAGLKEIVGVVHAGDRALAGIKSRIARRAADIAAEGQGPPAADTLLGRGAVSAKQAQRDARRGETARSLPKLGDKIDSGDAYPENVDAAGAAAARMATPEHKEQFRLLDGEIADKASLLPPETFRRWLTRKEAKIKEDHGLDQFEKQRAASHFGTRTKADGMSRLWGELDPEWMEIFQRRLRALARRIAKARNCPVDEHIQAEALIAMATGTGGGPSYAGILVLTDERTMRYGPHEDTVSETWLGQPVPPQTVARLACDAAIQGIEISGEGLPLRVGEKQRTATDAQRKALRALYRTCPIDSDTPFDRCEIHHVDPWEPSRNNTDIENLIPISSYWHHKCHEGGWKLTIKPDRSLELTKPNGEHYRTIPPPKPIQRE